MTLGDYALIQRELGFIEGITYEVDKDGDIGKSISSISELCKKAVTAEYIENKKTVTPSNVSDESEKILKTQYSTRFDELRKNRMIQSFYKYGPAIKNYGEGRVDAIGSLELCLEKFKKTGNTEYLVDVANYAMLRYMHPLPGEYFKATSSEESAGVVGTPINFEK